MKGEIICIDASCAWEFLKPRHYAGRKPQISKAFGWKINNMIVAVCTFGKPASNSLCKGICGEKYSKNVYELNRLCRIEELKEPLSQFVAACLRELKKNNWIVVSYSDTGMNHNGYIYQACNFMYTGCTKQRTDKWVGNGKHSRHYRNDEQGEYRIIRTAKHRYVYFCTSNNRLKKQWLKCLNYPRLPYPKAKNKNYILGEYYKPELVKCERKDLIK